VAVDDAENRRRDAAYGRRCRLLDARSSARRDSAGSLERMATLGTCARSDSRGSSLKRVATRLDRSGRHLYEMRADARAERRCGLRPLDGGLKVEAFGASTIGRGSVLLALWGGSLARACLSRSINAGMTRGSSVNDVVAGRRRSGQGPSPSTVRRDDLLLSAEQVAELLGMSAYWVREQTRKRKIPFVALGPKVRKYRLSTLRAWLAEHEERPR
jgi:excisionase family DNA binding protein